MPPRTSSVEHRALRLIYDAGDEGLLQSDLWKLLDVSSREGSRLAKKFEEKGRITREKVLKEGRWTYKLISKTEPVTLNSVKGCPCLICSEVEKCFRGGTKDPVYCQLLTAWIDPRIEIEETDSDQ